MPPFQIGAQHKGERVIARIVLETRRNSSFFARAETIAPVQYFVTEHDNRIAEPMSLKEPSAIGIGVAMSSAFPARRWQTFTAQRCFLMWNP